MKSITNILKFAAFENILQTSWKLNKNNSKKFEEEVTRFLENRKSLPGSEHFKDEIEKAIKKVTRKDSESPSEYGFDRKNFRLLKRDKGRLVPIIT